MLENSKDLLNIAIAISVFGIALMSVYAIFYLTMILRQAFKIVKEMRDRIHKLDELMKLMKDKIEHSTSYLLLIGEGVKKLVDVIKERTGDKKSEKKSKREKK